MPTTCITHITRTIASLEPNINSYSSNCISPFSWIQEMSDSYSSSIVPPTQSAFVRQWNEMRKSFLFSCEGKNLEQIKEDLKDNHFLGFQLPDDISEDEREEKIQAVTWVRIILAFNMYAEVRSELGLSPNNRIDFLGSIGRNNYRYGRNFGGRFIVFIKDNVLRHMIELVRNTETTSNFWQCPDFWQYIYDIYEILSFDCTYDDCMHVGILPHHNTNQTNSVDYPTHAIAQEYLTRINEDEDIIFNNQQIADMVMKTKNPLPHDLRKTIYEMCVSFRTSC